MSPPRVLVWILSCLAATAVSAAPWLAPGDQGLRSDLQLLADAGLVHGPVTTWPLSWPDIARDVAAAPREALDEATLAALVRVQHRARTVSSRGYSGAGLRLSGAYEPVMLRTFEDTPRDEGELSVNASWLGDHVALNLQATAVADPDDGQTVRADGSYFGVNVGNFVVSAGYMERWWGPGWDGSLILSTNARPMPSLTLDRNYSDPFKTKLLSWLGPWRATASMSQSDTDDVPVANVKFFAARLNFKPAPWIEIGLSRTAQWCGDGRPCGWQAFQDMLLGKDNAGDDTSVEDQPGNQMAGYDLRLRSPWRPLPMAFYGQLIGEDEAGFLPSKFLGLFGLEYWNSSRFGGLRVRGEYADTACMFSRQEPAFDCGFRNALYPQGYTYRGRIIGHSMDNDSRMYSLAALLTRPNGDVLGLTVRRVEVNRDGSGTHAISSVPLDLNNVELRYSRAFRFGKVEAGLGYGDGEPADDSSQDSTVHGFLTWHQGF